MKKTLIAAALTLAGSLGSLAIQSPASAASGGLASHGLITNVANTRTTQNQHMVQPPPQPETQAYPVYHDSPTASWYSQPVNRMPCHFTQAVVEGRMRQVEICN
ncbi:hypothetical protein LJR090_001301 [Bosea sp. LjRoot90]|uniref:hypothetical protein n=1 Tax=Bosea sp. LjRoot90 TaxID=3342342 RepID=UPI003ECE0FC7